MYFTDMGQMFQFHKVRLKAFVNSCLCNYLLFQFHKVRLKVDSFCIERDLKIEVSIP